MTVLKNVNHETDQINFLIHSIISHAIASNVKIDACMVVSTQSKDDLTVIKKCIEDRLEEMGMAFMSAEWSIRIGRKKIQFILPNLDKIVGKQIDYIFLHNIIDNNFLKFIDDIMRSFVVVVQTKSI